MLRSRLQQGQTMSRVDERIMILGLSAGHESFDSIFSVIARIIVVFTE